MRWSVGTLGWMLCVSGLCVFLSFPFSSEALWGSQRGQNERTGAEAHSKPKLPMFLNGAVRILSCENFNFLKLWALQRLWETCRQIIFDQMFTVKILLYMNIYIYIGFEFDHELYVWTFCLHSIVLSVRSQLWPFQSWTSNIYRVYQISLHYRDPLRPHTKTKV